MKHIAIKNAQVLVIGLGISGRAAAGYLLRHGARVTGVDQNPKVLSDNQELASLRAKGLTTTLTTESIDIHSYDLIVVSPGIPQADPLYIRAKHSGVNLIGEVELAFRSLKNPVLGITGTNGKTTTTLLVEHVLKNSGLHAAALGNSGVALTSEEAEKAILSDAVVVAELSSYQLDTMYSKVLDASVLLNITPDHLDRYGTMEAYAASKMQLERCMKSHGPLYIEIKCFQQYGYLLKKGQVKTYGFHPSCNIYCDLKFLHVEGKKECALPPQLIDKANHDVENFMAAYALCRFCEITPEQFLDAFSRFKKPSHRIEFIREHNGAKYYDDSKGTNLDAVIKAVEVMTGSVILIAGGVDKGAAYTPWIDAFGKKVRCIFAIGQAAPKIEKDLSHAIAIKRCDTLQDAVSCAAKMAKAGDNVLLSPGCSSFDMFRDYAHRGEEFQRMVKNL